MQARTQEEILVLKAQAGDARAFELLYKAYQPSLLKFAMRMLGREAAAKDAVQEAWITIARTLSALNTPSMFRARVFKAVRWRALDQLRQRPAEPVSLDAHDGLDVAAPSGAATGMATSDQLGALISALPEPERQAIYLFYLEEMKVTEIAAVLDVPAGTVKSRLNRARGRLKTHFEGDDNGID